VRRSRCAGRANAATPAADQDKQRDGRPPPASSSTAHALTSRPAGEQQTPPILRNAAASESPRSDRGERDTDKRSARRRRDIGQYAPGPSGTGKGHLAAALGVEAVRAGRSVYFSPLATADREGRLRERIRFLCRSSLLIIEIGYLTVGAGAGNLFFQLVNARYEKGAMILTSNRGFGEWGGSFWGSSRRDGLIRQTSASRCGHSDWRCQLQAAPTC